jgi:hypothetical protein
MQRSVPVNFAESIRTNFRQEVEERCIQSKTPVLRTRESQRLLENCTGLDDIKPLLIRPRIAWRMCYNFWAEE